MKLGEALEKLVGCGDDAVVLAKPPWTLESEALIDVLDEQCRVPRDLDQQGYKYVIDAPVAREALEVFHGRLPPSNRLQEFLLHYADNDAFPNWV